MLGGRTVAKVDWRRNFGSPEPAAWLAFRPMHRRAFTPLLGLVLAGCMVPQTVASMQDRNPPPEFGRPGWIRFVAGVGGWVGGAVGGVVSLGLLPVTYPISLLSGDGFGEQSRQEFLFFPAVGGAALGHFLLGTPPDVVDYVFRRAWVGDGQTQNSYELVPMEPSQPPALPAPQEVAPGQPGAADPGQPGAGQGR